MTDCAWLVCIGACAARARARSLALPAVRRLSRSPGLRSGFLCESARAPGLAPESRALRLEQRELVGRAVRELCRPPLAASARTQSRQSRATIDDTGGLPGRRPLNCAQHAIPGRPDQPTQDPAVADGRNAAPSRPTARCCRGRGEDALEARRVEDARPPPFVGARGAQPAGEGAAHVRSRPCGVGAARALWILHRLPRDAPCRQCERCQAARRSASLGHSSSSPLPHCCSRARSLSLHHALQVGACRC